jgi:hypothetical protein
MVCICSWFTFADTSCIMIFNIISAHKSLLCPAGSASRHRNLTALRLLVPPGYIMLEGKEVSCSTSKTFLSSPKPGLGFLLS